MSAEENAEFTGSILVVDDNAFVLETTTMLLQGYGFTVTACRDAEEALKKIGRGAFDVVLSDIKMPRMSGIELLRKIDVLNEDLPVILMTAYAELDTAIEALKIGAFDFIIKPYKPEYLYHSIKKAVNYHRLLQMERNYKYQLEEDVNKKTEELSRALSALTRTTKEIAERLTTIAEFRDTETGMHIRRIGFYSALMAESLDAPAELAESIGFASALHDIGKIGIPDAILLKPAALTAEEFKTMKNHTVIGEKMLRGSQNRMITMAASIALNHHERWDGSGYPLGKQGEDIPVEGRIAIIADQYDALRSRRPYKGAIAHEEVVRIIAEGDGRTMPGHFDPKMLKLFLRLAPEFDRIFNEHQD